jgi:hypothetical protein
MADFHDSVKKTVPETTTYPAENFPEVRRTQRKTLVSGFVGVTLTVIRQD